MLRYTREGQWAEDGDGIAFKSWRTQSEVLAEYIEPRILSDLWNEIDGDAPPRPKRPWTQSSPTHRATALPIKKQVEHHLMVIAEQPVEFVGWWEIVFYRRGGQTENIGDVIEHIHADGRFEAYKNGALIGAGRHVEFQTNPAGFTNIQEDVQSREISSRELVIYRLSDDTLEVCKAPEQYGRPVQFGSGEGTPVVHAAAKRIADTDPRIPKPL